jgi:flagellar biosynthesis/type III secretory pathway M-ring protein FliF/YscJ
MKEFLIYTGLRLLSLVATFGIVAGVWSLVAGEVDIFLAVIVAFVISGILSFFVLDPQRRAFAEKVEARAARAVEAARAKEDAEIDTETDTETDAETGKTSNGEGDSHKVS